MTRKLLSAIFEAISNGLVDELMRRRGKNAEVKCERSDCECDEDKGGDDAEESHNFAESNDEADVEEGQLEISGWYLLEHNYYLSYIH